MHGRIIHYTRSFSGCGKVLQMLMDAGGQITRRELRDFLYKCQAKNSARDTIITLRNSGLVKIDIVEITPKGVEAYKEMVEREKNYANSPYSKAD